MKYSGHFFCKKKLLPCYTVLLKCNGVGQLAMLVMVAWSIGQTHGGQNPSSLRHYGCRHRPREGRLNGGGLCHGGGGWSGRWLVVGMSTFRFSL